jgi:predicted Zn-ribbon and HTH transcriptional regulator
VKTFAWKATSNALAIEDNKLRRGMKVTVMCKICGAEIEDMAHALSKCPHDRRLWIAMRRI